MKDVKDYNLSIIRGDLTASPGKAGGDFVYGEVTNTRLMGVVGLHTVRKKDYTYFHQLFYLDFEEYGLDDYQSLELPWESFLTPKNYDSLHNISMEVMGSREVEEHKGRMFGGLGGTWKPIDENSSIYLLNKAKEINIQNDISLPDGIDEYEYLISLEVNLDEDTLMALWGSMCKLPENDYELINYFIMRLVGMDYDGARYLHVPTEKFNIIHMDSPGTLFRNVISEETPENNSSPSLKTYLTTSLIEDGTGYRTIHSRISVLGPKVMNFEVLSDMNISAWEASLISRKEEYIFYSKCNIDIGLLENIIGEEFPSASPNQHPDGVLHMIFRTTNDHVKNPEYRLDEDTEAMIYTLYDGEILISGHDGKRLVEIEDRLELKLLKSGYGLSGKERYMFHEPMLGNFIESGFDNFREFLDYVQSFET